MNISDFAWSSEDGGLHFDMPRLLAHLGVADNALNRAELSTILVSLMAALAPEAKCFVTLDVGGCQLKTPLAEDGFPRVDDN